MDDTKGRAVASRRGTPSAGALGVLRPAPKSGYLLLRDVVPRLLQTKIYIAPRVVRTVELWDAVTTLT